MQKKIILIAIMACVLVIGTLWWFAHREVIINYPPSTGSTVIVFGDSLVEGVGASTGHDMATVLSEKLGVPIVNTGKSGDTTAMGRARFDRDVLSLDPRVIFILLGGNDFLRRVPREETFNNLQAMVREAQGAGAMVVLLGVRGGLLGDSYEGDFAALAHETGVLYVPNVLDGLIGDRSLMSDEIHPNDRGYALIAEKIYKVVMPYADAFYTRVK